MNYIISLILVFISIKCFGQTNYNNEQISTLPKQVESKIDSLFTDFNFKNSPGYAIGIISDSIILYSNGFGSANLDYEIPISSNSSFDIASVSKQFTAACIALLIIDKRITLETPVSEFIPEISKYKDTIRIKHLIYNTSGLVDYYRIPRPDGKSWITFNYFDIDYCIDVSLKQDTLAFKPGDKWDYCNVNYMLLTKIVEKISGQSFREFSKQKLFDPIGMSNTFINDDVTEIIVNRVTPYNKRTKENISAYERSGIKIKTQGDWIQHPRNSPHYGGSGIVTTVNDLLKWSENFFTKKFGGQEFYNLMHRTEKFNLERSNQAFGLYFDKFKDRKFVAWDGGDYGISSQLIRFVDNNIAIIVLSNLGSGESYRKANSIAEILILNGYL